MTTNINRIGNYLLLGAVLLVLVIGYLLYDISFYRHHHLSGWLLFYLILAQVFYYVQKKSERIRQFLRLNWLSLHTELGIACIVVLLVHLDWSFPDGALGLLILSSFVAIALSGFIGLKIKNRYQNALAIRSGREIQFEDIPEQLQDLNSQVHRVMLECAAGHKPSLLVDYYSDWLSGAFATPGNVVAQLTGNNQKWLEHFGNIERLLPYLKPEETVMARELILMLRKKNELDFHYAHQGALRLWLFLHVPFAVCLLAFVALHVVLVYAFAGGG